jgi:hypothetical protein
MAEFVGEQETSGSSKHEIDVIRMAAASGASNVTHSPTLITQVVDMAIREYDRCRRAGQQHGRVLPQMRKFAAQQARHLVARQDGRSWTSWTNRIGTEDFAGYLDGDDASFGRILGTVLWQFFLCRLRRRWRSAQSSVVEDWAATARARMWVWWRRRPLALLTTPAALLAYAGSVVDHAPVDEHRRLAKTGEPENLASLAEDYMPTADFADGAARIAWLPGILDRWARQLPAACSPSLRPLLPEIATMARVQKTLPTVAALGAELGLSQRTARRRHAELCALLEWAAEQGEC